MGSGASKEPKIADKDNDGPPTVTEPSAPPPAFNPEYATEIGPPQPQTHLQPHMYPQPQPFPQPFPLPQTFPPPQPFPSPQPYPQPPLGYRGAHYPPGPPPEHSPTFSVPFPRHETTVVPPAEPVIPVVQSPDLPNEYLLETPSVEVIRTEEPQVNTDALKKYFSNNKKSHGGKIASLTEDDDCFVINFEDIEDAQEVLSHAHVLKGTRLQVHHRRSPTVKVIAGGPIDEDRLRAYFKNTRSSGGGPIEGEIKKDPNGVYWITFKSKRDAVNVLQKSQHSIEGTEIVVSDKLSQIDHKSLHIKDIPQGCTSSHLRDYLEGLESAKDRLLIADIFRGDNTSEAVVSLDCAIDGETRNRIAKEAKREPLKGKHVSVSPMVVTRSVQLSGLNRRFTRDLLLNYFSNSESSGGGKVLDITMDEKKGTAIIRFKDPTVVQRVVRKPNHEFECGQVAVCAHYDVLGTITETEVLTPSGTPVGHKVPRVIKRNELKIANVEPQKLCLLEQQLPSLQEAFPNVDFDFCHDQREITIKGSDDDPKNAHDSVKGKLDNFKECRWSISKEVQSILSRESATKTIEIGLAEENVQKAVHFKVEKDEVVILGVDESTVNTAESCIRSLFKETTRIIPKEILALSDWDDLMKQSHKEANYNAFMSLADKNSNRVEIVGLVSEVDAIEGKLDDFLKQYSFETSYVSAERPVVNVLLQRQLGRIQKIEKDNEVSIEATRTRTQFKITGPRDRINKVTDAVKALASTVMKAKEQYKRPGLGKLFKKDTFQKLLKGIEENQGCALTWDCGTPTPVPALREKTSLKDLYHARPSGSHLIGPISVDIQQGNIESESTHVILNPVTETAAFTVVGDALIKAGGRSIKREFERDWARKTNGVLLTGPGTLRCRKIAHMELPQVKDRLKDAVCQCLILSNQEGMTSIALPAVGTGKYGMKPSQSAKAIRDGIEQFYSQSPAPTLTHVKLTIFVQNMVADFKAEFCTPTGRVGGSATGAITAPFPGQQEMSFGSVKMQVQQGDISKERTDVIVSTIGNDMGFTVVTKALVTAGGQSIADELSTAWPSRTDDLVYVLTGPGNLPSKKVAHMVLPSATEIHDSVVSCLKAADKLGMTSISFPAIGTGGTMSQLESARGIYSGVQEFASQFNPQHLQLVRVTIFDSKMLGTFHSTMQQYSKSICAPAVPSGYIGSVAVQVQRGDLTSETTDAVVNPVDTDGGFFEIGRALEEAGGAGVRTACQLSWNQRRNDVLVADRGNLLCKKVIHMVCPNATTMKDRVHECLLQAERNGLTSVSFPAIGTGGVGVSVADAARETIQGINEFTKRSPKSVKLVRVTVFQSQMVAEFQQALQAATSAAASLAPRPVAKMTHKTDVEQVVEVIFYACDKREMDNAKRDVSQTIEDYMAKEHVEDDRLKATIRHLQQHEKDRIFQLGADYLVLVTSTGRTIEMLGLKDDVAVVLKEIEVFLQQRKAAFEKDQLEKDIIKVPDYWATPPPGVTGAYMHQLHETSREYREVETKFLSSVGCQPQIVSISRVQNEPNYKLYLSKLNEIKKTCTRSEIEEILYHGTAEDAVENINQGGFNRNYCGKNATAYGKGVYFAKNASYSAQDVYTPPNAQGNKHIYQARVIVGEYTTGKAGILEPPPKNPANAAIRYDSVVNDERNPTIFVVFNDDSAYPEYLNVFK